MSSFDSVATWSIGSSEPIPLSEAEQKIFIRVAALEFLLVELFSHLAASVDRDAPRAFASLLSIQMMNSFEKVSTPGGTPSEEQLRSKEIGETVQTILNAVVDRLPKDKAN